MHNFFPNVPEEVKKELKKLAQELYDSEEGQMAMKLATEKYPEYNSIHHEDHTEAVSEVIDILTSDLDLNEDDEDFLRDTLNDMISGGLA
jgi:hypothetical protein